MTKPRVLKAIEDEKLIILRALSCYAKDMADNDDNVNIKPVIDLIHIYTHEVFG